MEIKSLLESYTKKIIKEVKDNKDMCLKIGYEVRKKEIKNYYKHTERRLYNYPELISNIEKYNMDIKDIKKEYKQHGLSKKSKDICLNNSAGIRLSDEEILHGKIIIIQKKIERDEKEIAEIKYALQGIESDEWTDVIGLKYFEQLTEHEISEKLHTTDRTIRRHKNRLMNKIMVRLYGADVI